MWNDELNEAINEFLNHLPPQMIELALGAVHLKEQLDAATDL